MFHIKPLAVDLQRVACTKLGEITSRIPDILSGFKQWIVEQPHLKARMDDQFLIQFLRNCNYDVEVAKVKINNYYALKNRYPQYFKVTDVDDVQFRKRHNKGCFVALPTPLNDSGPRIYIFRFNHSVDEERIEDIFLTGIAQLEVMMMADPYTCIHGAVFITDLAKASTEHILQITPTYLKPLFAFFEQALPINIQTYLYINVTSCAEHFFSVMRMCMSEKLRRRLVICGQDIKSLTDRIPLKYLAKDYGGENGRLDQLCLEYNKVWDEQKEYFKQNDLYGVNESLCDESLKSNWCEFGIGGSFENIKVD